MNYLARLSALGMLLFLLSCTGGLVASEASDEARRFDLALERPPTEDEAVHVEVAAGALPRGARITVSLPDGHRVGTVAPYGVPAGRKAGTFAMALPRAEVMDQEVTLLLQLRVEGQPPRAPTEAEVEAVRLVFVPVTSSEEP